MFDENEGIYGRYHVGKPYDPQWGHEITINLYGVVWRVHLWPTAETIAALSTALDEAILITGVVVSALLAWLVSFVPMARRRMCETITINRKLAQEIIERQRGEAARHDAEQMHMIDMTGILLGTPLTGEQRELEGTVRSNADALLSTINGILDFSKIEAEKLAIESIDFDLRTTIESVVELMVEHAQRKGHELTALICHDAPTRLRGDPGRLRQVLTNPINTAIKFTAHSEVIVTTTKESKTDTHAVVCVEVRDTGTGIPQEAQGRPFQAFSGADGWTTRQYGGTGLGLAISRQLVDLMGGTISVESIPGRGSTFWFTLRLHKQPSVEGSSRQLPTKLDGVQVLVVNDNATNRKILHYQLKGWSKRHDSAADGREALAMLFREAAASDSHTLAILDMQMPEMDGLQLAQAIKTAPITASVRLLIMTSLSYDGDDRRFEDAGLLTFLTKPVKQSNSLTI